MRGVGEWYDYENFNVEHDTMSSMPSGKVSQLNYQAPAPPDGPSSILEILDDKDNELFSISLDENGDYTFTMFAQEEHIILPMAELEKALATARERIIAIDPEAFFK